MKHECTAIQETECPTSCKTILQHMQLSEMNMKNDVQEFQLRLLFPMEATDKIKSYPFLDSLYISRGDRTRVVGMKTRCPNH